jgi:hypothetical protein
MNNVDPKHFRKRLQAAIDAIFNAAELQTQANAQMAEALDTFKRIAGPGMAAAMFELATEPRRVCSSCHGDFMASDTGRDICLDCITRERMADQDVQ